MLLRLANTIRVASVGSGSRSVRHLACVLEHSQPDAPQNHDQVEKIRAFRQRHGLSDNQFSALAAVIGTDYSTVKFLSGDDTTEIEEVWDRKIREAGVKPRLNIEAYLNQKYNDINAVLVPSPARVKVLETLSDVFIGHYAPTRGSLGENAESLVSIVEARLNELQRSSKLGLLEGRVFNEIKHELKENPETFLIDTVAWINSALARANKAKLRVAPEQPSGQSSENVPSQQQQALTDAYNRSVVQKNTAFLKRFTVDNEGRTLLIDAPGTSRKNVTTANALLSAGHLGYVYGLLAGVSPLSVIVGYPLFALYMHNRYRPSNAHNVITVGQVYYKNGKQEPSLDVVLYKNGSVHDTISDVPLSGFKIHEKTSAQVEIPMFVNLKPETLPVEAARKKGFLGNYLPVSIKGTVYYLDSGFASNSELLNNLNLRQ